MGEGANDESHNGMGTAGNTLTVAGNPETIGKVRRIFESVEGPEYQCYSLVKEN